MGSEFARLRGVLIGTALGDSVGLPAEGLRRCRIMKLGWGKETWRQRFFFGWGMCSDDTEHTVMVLQSILEAGGDVERFRRRFGWRLRWWLLGLPAGVGMATAQAVIRLWLGIDPKRSGVFSAGNGPAMRSAIIGAFYAGDAVKRAEFVEASTLMTHSDPRALVGAMVIAELAARPSVRVEDVVGVLREIGGGDEEWSVLVDQMEESWSMGREVGVFAELIGCVEGVSGYVYRTVPVAVYAWVFHEGCGADVVAAVLDCGGDADTVGAIAGALCGAMDGGDSFPSEWLNDLVEWPRSVGFMESLARCPAKVPRVFWGFLLVRNVFFLLVVLMHGVLRCVPGGLRGIR